MCVEQEQEQEQGREGKKKERNVQSHTCGGEEGSAKPSYATAGGKHQ